MVMMVSSYSSTLPFYASPVSYQRGRGLGGVLRGIVRSVRPLLQKPMVKRGLKALGRAATAAVLEAGHQAMTQRNLHAFGPALKEAGKRQARQLLLNAPRTMMGAGSKRKRKPPSRVSRSQTPVKRRRVQSAPVRRDIFEA
jgi:hypothetical protein